MVDFTTTPEELETICRIISRACGFSVPVNRLSMQMDLAACHNSNPLKLDELLAAGAGDFAHDVFGIIRHMDRETGTLGDCFVPRFSRN